MTRPYVLAGFGGSLADPAGITWTDITEWAETDQIGISISRGASDEIADIQATTGSLLLDNHDGRFTPGRTSSPYWPNVVKNCPIRGGAVTTAKNLMVNPSFESGVTAWTPTGSTTRAASGTHVQNGTSAMLVTWAAAAGQSVTSPVLYGLNIGQQYTASAYVWVPAGHAAVQLALAGGAAGTASSTTGTFTRISCTFTATATSHQVQLQTVGTPAVGNQAWLDAVQLEEGGAATAFDADGAQMHDRWWAVVNDWPIRWSGLMASASITFTDVFKRLARDDALRPLLTEEILADEPLTYYPLSEPSDSTSAGDLASQGAGALATIQAGAGGALEFASGAGPAATGDGCPTFTPASATAGKYLRGDLGDTVYELSVNAGVDGYFFMECWFSTTATDRILFALSSTNSQWISKFQLESGTGKLKIVNVTPDTTFTYIVPTANLADGQLHHLLYDQAASDFWIDGAIVSSPPGVGALVDLRTLSVGGYAGTQLWDGTIAHLAIYPGNTGLASGDLTDHYTAGATGYADEAADVRVARLAGYKGIAVTAVGTAFDDQASQGQGRATALEMAKQVEATESARLISSRTDYGLVLYSRSVRYNPTPVLTISYADLETGDTEVSDDDQKMVNTWTGSRPGGATQRIVDQTSRNANGPYPGGGELLKTTDNAIADAGNWVVSRYANPQPELREIVVEAYSLPLATYRALLSLDVSSALTITDLPAQAPASVMTVFVEGYTESIRRGRHRLAFHTSRSVSDTVWVLDDPTYSVLGSTTRLAY